MYTTVRNLTVKATSINPRVIRVAIAVVTLGLVVVGVAAPGAECGIC